MITIEEASGKVTDYQGGELDLQLGTKEMVASDGLLYQALVDVTSGDGS